MTAMDKVLVVAICIFILVLAFIYADKIEETILPEETTQPVEKKRRGGSTSPIIPSPILSLAFYEDEDCTVELTAIDWGNMCLGETKNKTVYIINTGNVDVKVSINASDWVFKDYNGTVLSSDYQQYFNLSWSLEGATIRKGEVATAVISLYISPDIGTAVYEFTFNIYVTIYSE